MRFHSSSDPAEPESRQSEALQPLLDEALGQLDETDRQAVILRFLAGRDFAEIGQALGVSDDAAQKRVSRALARLRDRFRQRGIVTTEGALGLALGVAGAHVAPSGLAALVTASALAGLGTAGWMQTLTMMKTKLALTGAALALVVTPLTLQHFDSNRLRRENRALREQAAQLSALQAENERLARLKLDVDELARLRSEHVELMRLRGEVGRLRASASVSVTKPPKPEPSATATGTATRMLLSPMKARVKDGETLVTGGWTTSAGRRGVLMVTPQISGDTSDCVTVAFTLLEGAESAFAQAGLGDIRSDDSTTPVQWTFNPTEAATVLRQITGTGGVDVLTAPRVMTLDGRQAQISDATGGLATTFDVVPTIIAGAGGPAVEMTLIVRQGPSRNPDSAQNVTRLQTFTAPPAQAEGAGVVAPGMAQPGENE